MAIEPEFQKLLDEAIKENPPGDYPPSSPRSSRIEGVEGTSNVFEVISDDDSNDSRTRLQDKLDDIVIPSLSFKDTPAKEAFQMFHEQCIKNDKNGKGIRLAFELNVLTDGKLADQKITFAMCDVPAKAALVYLLAYFDFRYELHGAFILIRLQE